MAPVGCRRIPWQTLPAAAPRRVGRLVGQPAAAYKPLAPWRLGDSRLVARWLFFRLHLAHPLVLLAARRGGRTAKKVGMLLSQRAVTSVSRSA